MKSLEESVAISMDGTDTEILQYLPYILQDFWEIGASPSDMISLIEKHTTGYSRLKILDLGCGKGAVSIRIAEKLHCRCFGFDAISSFINEAREKSIQYKVSDLCSFVVADIREKIKELAQFDIIILGAIGQVFGNYYETLTILSNHMSANGIIIIDDAYIDNDESSTYSQLFTKQEMLLQIDKTGMKLIDELIPDENETSLEYDNQLESLKKRCFELMEKYPEKKYLFEEYIRSQEGEYDTLKNKVVCSTMVVKKYN